MNDSKVVAERAAEFISFSTKESIELADKFLSLRNVPDPHIYPTDDDGILLEFIVERWDWSLEFAPSGETIEMYGIHLDSRDEMEPIIFNSLDELLREFDKRPL